MGAFADADSGDADEQERIRRQLVGSAQLLLEELIILGREVGVDNEVVEEGPGHG